ncbi:hypothetical protein AMB3_4134 [plant metagenome]
MEDFLAVQRIGRLARAVADATQGAKAGLLDALVVVFLGGIFRRDDIDVAFGRDHDIAHAADVRALRGQVPARHHDDGIAREGGADGQCPIGFFDGVRGLGREGASRLEAQFVTGIGAFLSSQQVDVPACAHGQLLVGGHMRSPRIDVLPGDEGQVAPSGKHRADVAGARHLRAIAAVPTDRLLVRGLHCAQVDVAARLQTRIVGGAYGGGSQIHILPSPDIQAAGIDARDTADVRASRIAVGVCISGGGQVDVTPRLQGHGLTLDARGDVVDVLACVQVHASALDQAAGLVADVVRGHDSGVARTDGAAVEDIAANVERDIAARDERAVALQVALAHDQVHLRYQDGLRAAIRQRDSLCHHPDQVRGQVAHLLVGQRRAQRQAVLAGELGARRQQGLVLRLVVGVIAHIALARAGHDLVGHQSLFIETVAQPLERSRAVEGIGRLRLACAGRRRVGGGALRAQLLQQEVAGQHVAPSQESAVGGHQIGCIGRGQRLVQAAARDRGGRRNGAHQARAGQ